MVIFSCINLIRVTNKGKVQSIGTTKNLKVRVKAANKVNVKTEAITNVFI